MGRLNIELLHKELNRAWPGGEFARAPTTLMQPQPVSSEQVAPKMNCANDGVKDERMCTIEKPRNLDTISARVHEQSSREEIAPFAEPFCFIPRSTAEDFTPLANS